MKIIRQDFPKENSSIRRNLVKIFRRPLTKARNVFTNGFIMMRVA
jgi:hypothetical protein